MNSKSRKAGFTLVELLIGIVIIGMILGGLSQVLGHVLSTYQVARASQESVPEARYALERMVMFVQETDQITEPATITSVERLRVSERVSDQYNNASHAYIEAGDGLLDADNDADGLINEGSDARGDDPAEFSTFALDTTDASNWKLTEQMPDYPATGNPRTVVLCENIKPDPLNNPLGFSSRRLGPGIVEIVLTVQKGNATATLKTTARSRWVE
jgi:prepilin-type N-terminal cleavage/methylation domain-containing protein